MAEMNKLKNELRQRIIKERSLLCADMVAQGDMSGIRLADEWILPQKIRTIALYWSVRNEFSTRGLIQTLWDHGVVVGLPVINSYDRLEFYRLNHEDELSMGAFGIPIPPVRPERLIEPELFGAVILPGVAFDRNGGRLGMGKGYYDRFLKELHPRTTTMGVAYTFQIIDQVPMEPFDERIHALWTERGMAFSIKN